MHPLITKFVKWKPSTHRKLDDLLTNFLDSSSRKKRRKTEKIRNDHTVEELGFATQMKLRAEAKLHTAKIVEDVLETPSCASEYRRSLDESHEVPFSREEALS